MSSEMNSVKLAPPKVQKIKGVNADPLIEGVKFSEVKYSLMKEGF